MVALIGLFRRKLTLPATREALLERARITGMIFLILLGAELLKIFMARGGVPQAMAELMRVILLLAMPGIVFFLPSLIGG
ncbi:TRAP transporter large permease subunit [Loktanella agnita]|uniref:TRAP transporter large permease subunit n=1 Tax=Loktanella agnita TaxID=287097 RepID=UPI00398853A9